MEKMEVFDAYKKAFTDGDLVGNDGALQPEQFDDYYSAFKIPQNAMIASAHHELLDSDRAQIDNVHGGTPVTDWPADNAEADGGGSVYVGGSTDILTKKARASLFITTGAMRRGLKGKGTVATLTELLKTRGTYDIELACEMGDEAAYAAGTDARSKVLKGINGWDYLSLAARTHNVNGGDLDENVPVDMFKLLPDGAKLDPACGFEMSPSAKLSLHKKLQARIGALADMLIAQGGGAFKPMGRMCIEASSIPSMLAVAAGGATAATVLNKFEGSYKITSAAKTFTLNIDAAGVVTYDLLAEYGKSGAAQVIVTARQIVKMINDDYAAAHGATYANIASTTAEGRFMIKAPTTGAASAVVIAGGASSALAEIGLAAATTNGANSGGTVPQGTYVRLCNPASRVFAMNRAGTRVYPYFWPRNDRLEVVKYDEVRPVWRDLENVVVARNVLVS